MKIRWSIILLVFASAIILALLYQIMNPENRELDEAVRSQLGGSYLRLSRGVTHYALEGISRIKI